MACTPKELDDAVAAEVERIRDRYRAEHLDEPPLAKKTVAAALQRALGELAQIQRLLDETSSAVVDFATLEEIANLAENVTDECQMISSAVNEAFK